MTGLGNHARAANARNATRTMIGLGTLALLVATTGAALAANWGTFQKQCVGDGTAKFAAVLHGIPFGQSWEKTCAVSGANINVRHYGRPTRCVNTGNAMWGEFVVPDSSCARPKPQLRWGDFKDNGCVTIEGRGIGMRSY